MCSYEQCRTSRFYAWDDNIWKRKKKKTDFLFELMFKYNNILHMIFPPFVSSVSTRECASCSRWFPFFISQEKFKQFSYPIYLLSFKCIGFFFWKSHPFELFQKENNSKHFLFCRHRFKCWKNVFCFRLFTVTEEKMENLAWEGKISALREVWKVGFVVSYAHFYLYWITGVNK